MGAAAPEHPAVTGGQDRNGEIFVVFVDEGGIYFVELPNEVCVRG